MIITETCSCAAEFSVDNADHRTCSHIYTDFLREHWECEGRAERQETKKSVLKTLTFEPRVN